MPPDLVRLFAATTFAGAVGSTLGAGLGELIRNIGGAVTTAVLLVFLIPPLAVQLFSQAGSWIPTSLFTVISRGQLRRKPVGSRAGDRRVCSGPAAAGLASVQRRDVV